MSRISAWWNDHRTEYWQAIDTACHKLHLPWHGWICDHYDMALGFTRDEIRRSVQKET